MKRCPRCTETKPDEAFYRSHDRGRERLSSYCKPCQTAYSVARAKADPARQYALRIKSERKRRYGLSDEDYMAMVVAQDGLCAICRRPPNGHGSLHVDHDHDSGKVRGLLCASCNLGMGSFGDDPDRLNNAVTYLEHGYAPPL